jgi:hypothetical protein
MIRRLDERLKAQNTTRGVCMSQDLSSYRVKNEMSGSANAIPVIKTKLKYKMSGRLTGHAKTLKFL